MLEIRGIRKSYQKAHQTVHALRELSAHIGPGEFVAVLGPSGSGKTTLFLAAGGLLKPDSGQIIVDGEELYSLTPNGRARLRATRIGFVFQQYHLIPYLNVLENVLAPGLASPTKAPTDRAMELINGFGLAERLRHLPAELSAGECQRVALARALFHKPGLLLADEPTGNLDEENADGVLNAVAEFAKAGGAVLLVTHDKTVAKHADRMLHIEKGVISTLRSSGSATATEDGRQE